MTKKDGDKNPYNYTIAQWAATEGRFKKHFYKIKPEDEAVELDELILRLNQNDIVHRRFLDKNHRSYTPKKGIYVDVVDDKGKKRRMGVSRQLALFTVERRKNWRMLQSKAGIDNIDYRAHKELLRRVDAGEIELSSFLRDTKAHFNEVLESIE